MLALLAASLSAQPRKLWLVSLAALTAANVADAQSSWGRPELNGILGARFGGRGIAIKVGINGAWIVGQVIVLRRHRAYRAFAVGNFAAAGVFTGAAVHNYGVK